MRFLGNESGAARTEYSLIAAGIGFAISLTDLPAGLTLPRSAAVLVLLLAWSMAEWWLCRRSG
jgi:hypothetical protein